ncbi:MAG: hypothetical protein K8F91_21570 [Candidatus Obscuribacterales bacterium]|nr:hypothetical protein [Candidatus Obscuribacterales bacterium]
MEDITPLNLEDQPKLFGLRYDQLITCLVCFIIATQLYSWLNPIPFCGQDLRLDAAILICLFGPAYCLVTMSHSAGQWESLIGFYMSPQVFIPGPDPNPERFLSDEQLPEFIDVDDDMLAQSF